MIISHSSLNYDSFDESSLISLTHPGDINEQLVLFCVFILYLNFNLSLSLKKSNVSIVRVCCLS